MIRIGAIECSFMSQWHTLAVALNLLSSVVSIRCFSKFQSAAIDPFEYAYLARGVLIPAR